MSYINLYKCNVSNVSNIKYNVCPINDKYNIMIPIIQCVQIQLTMSCVNTMTVYYSRPMTYNK